MENDTTYKKIVSFTKIGNAFLKKNILENTKLTESVKNVLRKIRKDEILQNLDELINENNLSLCSVDGNGNIMKDEKGCLMFTPEKQLELNKKNKETFNLTVKLHTCILPENKKEVEKLDELEIDAFSGIVIEE